MADSNITKNALAGAIKSLMIEMPFAKITISDICNKCGMNRKSFYYHFKDKYDLVNWIFDTEFLEREREEVKTEGLDIFLDICQYLYDNKQFYRRAFEIDGQNSFSDHFEEFLSLLMIGRLQEMYDGKQFEQYQINFFCHGFLGAIVGWIRDNNESLNPKQFIDGVVKFCVMVAREKGD